MNFNINNNNINNDNNNNNNNNNNDKKESIKILDENSNNEDNDSQMIKMNHLKWDLNQLDRKDIFMYNLSEQEY